MSDWFLGEIRAFPMNWAPDGWHVCDGTVLPVQGNQALFALIGNTYGGTPPTTFALPDLRGRAILGTSTAGGTYPRGVAGGAETVALTVPQIPAHNHSYNVLNAYGATGALANNTISGPGTTAAITVAPNLFAAGAATLPLNPSTIQPTGAGAGHNNMQPSLVINYCIAIAGLFPSRN